tara:strand:+ start:1610 stop:1927 length:318 start_codon:yes stop_codon:yes gene_type:complete
MSWTEEEVKGMLELADAGKSIEEASEAMINTGWENRTVASLRSKYRIETGEKWPSNIEKEPLILEDEIADDIDYVEPYEEQSSRMTTTIVLFLFGIGLLAYGWLY